MTSDKGEIGERDEAPTGLQKVEASAKCQCLIDLAITRVSVMPVGFVVEAAASAAG